MDPWLVVPVYWMVLLVAYWRKKACALPFRFLEGFCLSFVCFWFLPPAFLEGVLLAAIGAVVGILFGVFVEGKGICGKGRKELWGGMVYTLLFLLVLLPVSAPVLVQGAVGGLGLYAASSGLLPEGGTLRELLPTAVGGVLGFLFGAWYCIF